jgi:hypothetical protein
MLSLLGLKDDYSHDGRVLIEALDKDATPKELNQHKKTTTELGAIYEQLNAPFGRLAVDVLVASTRAIKSTDESAYNSIENSIADLTTRRDALASTIKSALGAAAFDGQQIKEKDAKDWIAQAQQLLNEAAALAAG